MNKLLITGSSGFIGRNLVKYFSKFPDWEVTTADLLKSGNPAYILDLSQRSNTDLLFKNEKPDFIIHAAGITKAENAQDYFQANLIPVVNLLESAVKSGVFKTRILLISTSAVYGHFIGETVSENHLPAPINSYGYSKLAMETLASQFVQENNMDIVIARPFNIIGEGQPETFVVPSFIRKLIRIKNDKKLTEIKTGDLSGFRDFIDISDVVAAIKIIFEKGKSGEAYNIGSGRLIQISEVLKQVAAYLKLDSGLKIDEYKTEVEQIFSLKSNCAKLHKLGWKPGLEFEESLNKMIEFELKNFQSNPD